MKKYIQPDVKVYLVRPMEMVANSLDYSNAKGTTGNVVSGCNDAKEDEYFDW